MGAGVQRHVRAMVYMQAVLVWGLRDIDAEAWIECGTHSRGPVVLDESLAAAVDIYERKVREAGQFVMPDEVWPAAKTLKPEPLTFGSM